MRISTALLPGDHTFLIRSNDGQVSSKVDEAVQASNGTSVVALGIVHDQQLLWTYGAGTIRMPY
jgi:hypothetical protein